MCQSYVNGDVPPDTSAAQMQVAPGWIRVGPSIEIVAGGVGFTMVLTLVVVVPTLKPQLGFGDVGTLSVQIGVIGPVRL
jgi:hypothetical protein